MARSSKGSKTSTRKRVPLDWVVNDYTYSANQQSLSNNEIIGMPLTFPRFILAETTAPGGIDKGGYAYPEQSGGQMAYAVKGSVEVIPETWAVGSIFRYAARIVVKPMDWTGGLAAITDSAYTLYDAAFANERFLWQKHVTGLFSLGSQAERLYISAKFRAHIPQDSALYIFIENQTGVTSRLFLRFNLRTLMRAEE